MLAHVAQLVALLPAFVAADVISRIPDAAPPGFEQWTSEIVLPAKNITGDGDWASATAKARAFVAQLTLEEKINVTTGIDVFGRCVGETGAIPRLGWRGLCLNDSPLGVRFADLVSVFPAGINAAATWDKDLIYERGVALGEEFRGKGVNVYLGPMMNLGRVAAGGRNWEGFGADPFLTGVAAAETIKGAQSVGVIANAKHFIANEQEHYRGGSLAGQVLSSNIDDRTMHELYLWPFAESVKAGVASAMCSYNKVNQTQSCQNSKILNGLLKEELDFQGPIMSDWAAAINGVQPALAGMDMNMPGFRAYGQGAQDEGNPVTATNGFWGANLIQAVNNGSVPEWRLDDMVTRTLAAWYKTGQDQGYPAVSFSQLTKDTYLNGVKVNDHVNVQADHYKNIRAVGAASTVLLKNVKGALPLDLDRITKVGIFGSDAGPNPAGPNSCNDKGCDAGTLAVGWGSGQADFPYLVDPYSAIQGYVRQHAPTTALEAVLEDFDYAQVGAVARRSDTCLVFVNSDSGEGYITVAGNAGDRNNLTLWHGGDDLIQATAAQCSNTIVTMHTVGPVLVESWIDNPNVTAVLMAGLPGQESGNAIVDVLFGKVNPSARLPYTIAKRREDYPADVLYTSNMSTPQENYDEALEIDYRHFDAHNIQPRFEFGFGLSYTTFKYSGLNIRQSGNAKRDISLNPPTPSASHSDSVASSHAATASVSGSAITLSATSAVSSTLSSVASNAASSASASQVSSASATASGTISASISASRSASASGSVNVSSSAVPSNTASAPPVISSPIETSIGGPADLYDEVVSVTFAVRNSGDTDGYEVSQLYLGFPESANEPPRVLRGFERTNIRAGKTATVTIGLRRRDLSVWDVVSQKWVVPKGKFQVFIGASSRDIRLKGSFTP